VPITPLPSVPSTMKFLFQQTLGSDADVLNRLFFTYSGGPPAQADCLSFATGAATAWNSDLASHLSTSLTLTSVTVTDLASSSGQTAVAAVSHAGSVASPGIPAGSCMVVHGHIARRYRGGHQRWYQSGIPETYLTNPQQWATADVNAFSTAFSSFATAIAALTSGTTSGLAAVQVSYYSGSTQVLYPSGRYHTVPTKRATGITDPVTGWTVNTNVASQRRRNQLVN
jgi:hypothetical protein